MFNLTKYKKILDEKNGQRKLLKDKLKVMKSDLSNMELNHSRLLKAQKIIQINANETQAKLGFYITDPVNLCLGSIFEDPYKLHMDFELKRNQTECNILLKKGDYFFDPLNSSGGGIVDVVSFGLRISLWSISNPKTTPLIILDEPFKHLSKNLHHKASEMIQEISSKTNMQFIIITHSEELAESANKVFNLSIKNGISYLN